MNLLLKHFKRQSSERNKQFDRQSYNSDHEAGVRQT